MKVHRFERTQVLPISPESAWEFFSDPKNLDSLTPPELAFRTLSGDDEPIFEGQIIAHRIRLMPGIWSHWTTEIVSVAPGNYFIDEQRAGPYRFWHHLHRFSPSDDGVEMLDRVHYALPLAPLSSPAHALFVAPQLEKIFNFRREKLQELFPASDSAPV